MSQYFFIKSGDKYIKLYFSDILYVEAEKNYVHIVLPDKQYLTLASMKAMEKILPEDVFSRIHRSYIVSLNAITSFDKHHVYLDKIQLKFGEGYQARLKSKLVIIMGQPKTVKVLLPG